MGTPKISVVIPCYNMELYLADCLNSVLSQTLSEIEAICVNDGSTDSTLEILKQYRQRDDRVVIIDQENQGAAIARNHAISKACGEYIAFMDPDDFYPATNTLELLYTKASDHQALICGGSMSSFNNITGAITTKYSGNFEKNTFTEEGFIDYRDYQFDFSYHRFLYKRIFLLENDLFFPPYRRFEDPPFFVRAMITAGSFYAIPDIVYRYRWGIQASLISWSSIKFHGLLRGYLDNVTISAQNRLSALHALTVNRFEADNVTALTLRSLKSGDMEALEYLIKINQAICPELLKEAGVELNADGSYTLRQLQEVFRALSEQEHSAESMAELELYKATVATLTCELEAVKNSVSFRFGRALTYIPRKIRGGVVCCREHGIGYTVKRTFMRIWGRIAIRK